MLEMAKREGSRVFWRENNPLLAKARGKTGKFQNDYVYSASLKLKT